MPDQEANGRMHGPDEVGFILRLDTPTSVMVSVGTEASERLHMIRGEPGEVDLARLSDLAMVTDQVHAGTISPAEGSTRLAEIDRSRPPYGPAVTILAFGLSSAALALGRLSVYVATVAGLIILMPGFQITVGMTELSSRHLVSGTARLSGAFVTLVAMAFGVAIGSKLVAATLGEPPIAQAAALPAWTEGLALLVAPLAFTVLLRAHRRDAVWILLSSAVAFGGGWLLRRPAAVTLVPGILLLVPGSIGFRSLTSVLDREVVLGVETAFKMILMAVALAAGILVANAIAPARTAV